MLPQFGQEIALTFGHESAEPNAAAQGEVFVVRCSPVAELIESPDIGSGLCKLEVRARTRQA